MSLPSADDLFRPTVEPEPGSESGPDPASDGDGSATEEEPTGGPRKPSGRVRHDEKVTVYMTADELLDLEHSRLGLRRSHGLAVDRGRLVREAVAIALADFELNGEDSVLVQRLTQR